MIASSPATESLATAVLRLDLFRREIDAAIAASDDADVASHAAPVIQHYQGLRYALMSALNASKEADEAAAAAAPASGTMTDDRFNELVNGPLSHPFPVFALTRLAIALRVVVHETGAAGAKALEDHCATRQALDERDA